MQKTNISWTEFTWNPGCGCPAPVSPGCDNCWARQLHNTRHLGKRQGKKLPDQYNIPFEVIQQFPERLDLPLRRKTPTKIAVNLMGDLFAYPFEFIDKVVEVAEVTPWHTYQILTKRVDRMLEYFKWRWNNADQHTLDCTKAKQWKKEHGIDNNNNMYVPNIWLGVSAENQEWWEKRKQAFFDTPAAIHFVSFEPLLGEIVLSDEDLKQLDQVIIGAESNGAYPGRECKSEWIENILEQCQSANVPCFVKQIHYHDAANKLRLEKNSVELNKWNFPQQYPKGD